MAAALYVLVEGGADLRFFEHVFGLTFRAAHSWVTFVPWAESPKQKIGGLLGSIESMSAEYIFVRDLHGSPCVSARKDGLLRSHSRLSLDRVAIVVPEIEAWYLAGLDATACRELGLPEQKNTDALTKQRFDNAIPKRFDSRLDFLREVLKNFSVAEATRKNASFAYFVDKYGP